MLGCFLNHFTSNITSKITTSKNTSVNDFKSHFNEPLQKPLPCATSKPLSKVFPKGLKQAIRNFAARGNQCSKVDDTQSRCDDILWMGNGDWAHETTISQIEEGRTAPPQFWFGPKGIDARWCHFECRDPTIDAWWFQFEDGGPGIEVGRAASR